MTTVILCDRCNNHLTDWEKRRNIKLKLDCAGGTLLADLCHNCEKHLREVWLVSSK